MFLSSGEKLAKKLLAIKGSSCYSQWRKASDVVHNTYTWSVSGGGNPGLSMERVHPPHHCSRSWIGSSLKYAEQKTIRSSNAFPTTVITAQVSFTFKFYQRHCKVCCKIEHNMRPVVRLVIPLWKMVYAFFVLYSATVIRVTTNRYARVHIRAGKAIG